MLSTAFSQYLSIRNHEVSMHKHFCHYLKKKRTDIQPNKLESLTALFVCLLLKIQRADMMWCIIHETAAQTAEAGSPTSVLVQGS